MGKKNNKQNSNKNQYSKATENDPAKSAGFKLQAPNFKLHASSF